MLINRAATRPMLYLMFITVLAFLRALGLHMPARPAAPALELVPPRKPGEEEVAALCTAELADSKSG